MGQWAGQTYAHTASSRQTTLHTAPIVRTYVTSDVSDWHIEWSCARYVHVYVHTYICAYMKLHTVGVGQSKHEEECSLPVLVAYFVHVQQ